MASNILQASSYTNNRGIAYECLKCKGTDRPVVNAYAYVLTHFRKNHLKGEECPAWCRLCDYRTEDLDKLKEHIHTYPRHKDIVRAQKRVGITIKDATYFYINENPTIVVDIGMYSREESREHYKKQSIEKGRKRVSPHVDKENKDLSDNALPTPELLNNQLFRVMSMEAISKTNSTEDTRIVQGSSVEVKESISNDQPVESDAESSDSSSSSESDKENEKDKDRFKSNLDHFSKEMNRNLQKASDYINTCFKIGEDNMSKLIDKMEEQTKALNQMTQELKEMNDHRYNDYSRSSRRHDNNYRDKESDRRRYHPY